MSFPPGKFSFYINVYFIYRKRFVLIKTASSFQIDDVNEAYPNRLCVDSIFDDIVLMHLSAAFYVKKKKYCTAYNLQLAIINTFLKEILQKEKDSNWYIPLLGVFCSDLILLAKKSEEQDHDLDPEPYMEDVANVIMGLYRQCVADNRTDLQASKKVSIVSLTVRLFKLYFEVRYLCYNHYIFSSRRTRWLF